MKEYTLNVAGYRIRFGSMIGGPDLAPGPRFLRNVVKSDGTYDLFIRVHTGVFPAPENLKRVFHAPLMEEIGTRHPVRRLENFWSVYKHKSGLMLSTVFPLNSPDLRGSLRYSLEVPEWDLYVEGATGPFDPFEYPLDGLILYYLTVMNGDIFIHGSAVEHEGKGYLFTGISGSGKTTMARIWEREGARVIHDDRIIIRRVHEGFELHNTPVYNDDEPRNVPLSRIFLIAHGMHNEIIPMRGANALSRVMSNCIQHNWSTEIIGQLTGSLYLLIQTIPVCGYWFVPDSSAVQFALTNES